MLSLQLIGNREAQRDNFKTVLFFTPDLKLDVPFSKYTLEHASHKDDVHTEAFLQLGGQSNAKLTRALK